MSVIRSSLVLLALLSATQAAEARSTAARYQFQKHTPCPSTGRPVGKCPGFVIDHIVPLACGGADASSNMQWQTVAEAKAKDRWERKDCQK